MSKAAAGSASGHRGAPIPAGRAWCGQGAVPSNGLAGEMLGPTGSAFYLVVFFMVDACYY